MGYPDPDTYMESSPDLDACGGREGRVMGEDRRVRGHCPMGCGETLFLGSGGYVTCSLIGCPEPDAASTLLEDPEHEHIVEMDADVFTVRHPLRERLRDELMTCGLHRWIAGQAGPPFAPGRYRVHMDDGLPGRWLPLPAPADAG
jgi:hypothetical protein